MNQSAKLYTPIGWVLLIALILALSYLGPAVSPKAKTQLSTQRGGAPMAKWVYVVSPPALAASPALGSDGTIYSSGRCLFALDSLGKLKWETASSTEGCPATLTPVVSLQGDIYGASFNVPTLFALRPNGSIKWTSRVITTSLYIPELASDRDGVLYVSKGDYSIVAVNPDDGTLKWDFNPVIQFVGQTPSRQSTRAFFTATHPVIQPDGTILLAGNGMRVIEGKEVGFLLLYTLYPNGHLKQQLEVKLEDLTRFIYRFILITVPVLAVDGTIYLATMDLSEPQESSAQEETGTSLYALGASGEIRWSFSLNGEKIVTEPVLAADGTIYLGTITLSPRSTEPYWSTLYAISPDGRLKWAFHHGWQETIEGTPAVGADGVIYVPTEKFGLDYKGKLYALSPEGKVLWSFQTIGDVRSSPALAQDGTLYFVTVGPCQYVNGQETNCEGRVYALQASSPGLANSPWPMFRHDPQHSGRMGTTQP